MTDYTGVVDIARNGVDETIRISRQVGDLAMLVARLARSLKCAWVVRIRPGVAEVPP